MDSEQLGESSTELDLFGIFQLFGLLRSKLMRSSLTDEAKIKAIQDLLSAELKVITNLNSAKEQVNNKSS